MRHDVRPALLGSIDKAEEIIDMLLVMVEENNTALCGNFLRSRSENILDPDH